MCAIVRGRKESKNIMRNGLLFHLFSTAEASGMASGEDRASASSTTGGGLAFIGDLDRYFKAFDVKTGKVVWQTRLGSAPHGYPVTYAAGGKQYIAVTTGMGVFKLVTAQQSPDIYQPSGGNMLYVFELAD